MKPLVTSHFIGDGCTGRLSVHLEKCVLHCQQDSVHTDVAFFLQCRTAASRCHSQGNIVEAFFFFSFLICMCIVCMSAEPSKHDAGNVRTYNPLWFPWRHHPHLQWD